MRFYTLFFGIFFSIVSINLSAGFAFPHLVYVCNSLSKAAAISIAAQNVHKMSLHQESYACNLLRQNQSNTPVENKTEPMRAVALPIEIRLTEQQYQERKKTLEYMRQEFSIVRDDLLNIKELYGSDSFLGQLLDQGINEKKNLFTKETCLVRYKNDLMGDENPEEEVEKLENKIITTHALLVTHFDSLTVQAAAACNSLEHYFRGLDDVINEFNANHTTNTDKEILQLYEKYLYGDFLIHDAQQKLAALQATCVYYRTAGPSSCMGKGSNIFERLDTIEKYIIEKDLFLRESLAISTENILGIEQHCKQKNISILNVKEMFLEQFSQDLAIQNNNFIKQAQKNYKKLQVELLGSSVPVMLEDTEDDDDTCRCNCGCSCKCGEFHGPYFEKLKRNHSDKVVVKRFGPFYQDPITKLWWAYGQGDHGGPHCKVFKRVANGLEFVFNGDINNGSIIDKQHKGKKGKFIHKDDIIPCGQKKKKNCKHCG